MSLYHPPRRIYLTAVAILLLAGLLSTFSFMPAGEAAGTAGAALPVVDELDFDFFSVIYTGDEPDAFVGDGRCETNGGLCSFRAALQEANASENQTFISIQTHGIVNLTSGLPAITSQLSISGPFFEEFTLRRHSGGDYRILTIDTSAQVDISRITISNGKGPDGAAATTRFGGNADPGGGILHLNGSLTLRAVNIIGNRTGNGGNATGADSFGGFGGDGGGLASFGPLTMRNCRVEDNVTGSGGAGGFGGSGGRGGGIYLASQATLTDVVVDGNKTGDGATGSNPGTSGVHGGDGGGMFAENAATTLTNLTVTNNITGNAVGGNSGNGGGLYLFEGTVSIVNSTVSNNRTGNASGFGAHSGFGGGIRNHAQTKISGTTISGNQTGSNGESGNGGGGAGITNSATIDLSNSTVSGNSIGAGDSEGLIRGGGGISNWFGTITITNCTITGNSAFANNVAGVSGIFTENQTIIVRNTIIAQNGSGSAPEVNGTFSSQGNNLIGNGDGATGFIASDLVGTAEAPVNALLGVLADNGGPTRTHALLAGSPALDGCNNALARDANHITLTNDQRGSARIVDSADANSTATVDIGAYEFHQTLDNIPDQTTNEDVPITISFGIGDAGAAATSVTASSNNETIVHNSNLTVEGTGGVRSLEIQPSPDQFGTVTITVTVNLSGGGIATDSFLLLISPINDRPRFAAGNSQQVFEDAGPQTVTGWATFIDSGINDGAQALTFVVTHDNPDLFEVPPAISVSGTLTYTVAANRSGSANVTVVLKDDGGTSNGGQDTSFPATFVINVIPVDDPPVLLTEQGTQHAIALDLVNHTRDPFSLLNPLNLSTDKRRRVSLFVWRLGLRLSDTVASVTVVARDNEGRTYNLPVESLRPVGAVADVTQVVVRLPDNVVGAPRDLLVKVTLRGPGSNEGFIKIAGP